MIENGHTTDEARQFVWEKRPQISNNSYMYLLYALENQLNEARKKKLEAAAGSE